MYLIHVYKSVTTRDAYAQLRRMKMSHNLRRPSGIRLFTQMGVMLVLFVALVGFASAKDAYASKYLCQNRRTSCRQTFLTEDNGHAIIQFNRVEYDYPIHLHDTRSLEIRLAFDLEQAVEGLHAFLVLGNSGSIVQMTNQLVGETGNLAKGHVEKTLRFPLGNVQQSGSFSGNLYLYTGNDPTKNQKGALNFALRVEK